VGVAIAWPDGRKRYWRWAHTSGGNNCTEQQACLALSEAWESSLPLLFHNAHFDVQVACEKLGAPEPPWQRVHDTLFLAYLCDPHARSLGLKELAADLLGWPADERDAIADWVWDNRHQLEQTYPQYGKVNRRKPGAWIFAAPGSLVEPYAIGDVDRTLALFKHLWPIVQRNGMGAAYDRERRCLPIFMENERRGIRVDVERLHDDMNDPISGYHMQFHYVEDWLRRELHAGGLNFDADQDVAAVLLQRGVVPQENWAQTASGQLSVSKDNLLPEHFTGPNGAQIASALGYRNRLKTCLSMFMEPWLEQAEQMGGYVSTNWNQVRGDRGGTRTGRPSTQDPNLLNISKSFEGRDDGYQHPAFLGVEPLPLVRKYVLPDEGEVFLHRDFDGQELRLFAHFEQGDLWQQYQDNAALDPHEFVGNELMRVAGRELERTRVKTLNFQSIYGGGVPALQRKLRCSIAEAKQLKAFHNAALPGRKLLNEEITRIVRRGEPIRTWGGRLYYPEKPGADGRDKIYKLINYVVQGSAADLTKQCLIEWYESGARKSRFLVTVYDEINISTNPDSEVLEMELLRTVMEEPRLSVPMRSSGKRGLSWGALTKCA